MWHNLEPKKKSTKVRMTYGTTMDHKNVDTCQKPIVILQCFRQPLDKGAIDGELKIGPSTICP